MAIERIQHGVDYVLALGRTMIGVLRKGYDYFPPDSRDMGTSRMSYADLAIANLRNPQISCRDVDYLRTWVVVPVAEVQLDGRLRFLNDQTKGMDTTGGEGPKMWEVK